MLDPEAKTVCRAELSPGCDEPSPAAFHPASLFDHAMAPASKMRAHPHRRKPSRRVTRQAGRQVTDTLCSSRPNMAFDSGPHGYGASSVCRASLVDQDPAADGQVSCRTTLYARNLAFDCRRVHVADAAVTGWERPGSQTDDCQSMALLGLAERSQ